MFYDTYLALLKMALEANESNEADGLEDRLDRLWNDRQSLPVGATLAGAIVNLGNLIAPVFGMLGRPLAFETLYYGHDIYFCFTIHLFIFLCYLVQEALFVFAYFSSSSKVV